MDESKKNAQRIVNDAWHSVLWQLNELYAFADASRNGGKFKENLGKLRDYVEKISEKVNKEGLPSLVSEEANKRE